MLFKNRLKSNNKPNYNILAWVVWLTAGLFYMYEFIHRVSPNVMVPELMLDFKVSWQTLGNLSAYYYYAYALAQIPVGIMLDRYSTRYLLMFAALLIAIGSFTFAKTDSIHLANLSRVTIGLGSAFSFVACIRLAANWFFKQKLGLVIGLTNLLGVLGAVIAGRPLAHLVDKVGWRESIDYLGVIGVIFIFLIWAIVRDKPTYTKSLTANAALNKSENSNSSNSSNSSNNIKRKSQPTPNIDLKISRQLKLLTRNKQVWFIGFLE